MSELAFNRIILQKNVRILSYVVLLLLVLNLLQAIVLIKFSRKPVLLVKENQTGSIEMLNFDNYRITEAVVENFVRWISNEYLSFGPESLPAQIESIKHFLSVESKESILKSYDKHKKSIESGVFFQFTLKEMEISKKSNPYQIDVSGVMSILDKNGRYKQNDRTYVFDVLQVKPTFENPYGLKVISITEKIENEGGEL